MKSVFRGYIRGYTVVELMVTILIVTVLATSVGVFFVSLLTIQENEREDGYVREKLADICAAYADMLSVASSFATNTDQRIIAQYPREAGGVSIETGGTFTTGNVVRVACLTSSVVRVSNAYNFIRMNVCAMDIDGCFREKYTSRLNGDAELLPLPGNIKNCKLMWIKTNGVDCASLGCLEIEAEYEVKNRLRKKELKTATARRVVRLWNSD